MAHQVNWYMGRRIIYALIQSKYLSLADLKGLNDQLLLFIHQSDEPYVHVILDANFVTKFQSRLPNQALTYSRDSDLGWNIVIAPDAVAKQFQPLFARTAHFDHFTSLEEGMFFLQDVDASLLASV